VSTALEDPHDKSGIVSSALEDPHELFNGGKYVCCRCSIHNASISIMAHQMLLQRESDQVFVDQHEVTSREQCPLLWRTPMSDLTVGNMFVAGAAFTTHL
jgi:hypothetical protein